jgi:putative ABC transport system permease protein
MSGGGYNPVSTDFFRTFGVRLARGRDFTAYDTEAAPWVAIVNETAARMFWKDQNPIGARIRIQLDDRPREVVGIVADVKHDAVQEGEGRSPQIYVPQLQQSLLYPWNRTRGRMHMSFAVQSGSRRNWESDFRRIVAQIDPDMPVYAIQPMRHYVAATEGAERLYLTLLGIFAGVAVILAAIGVYGVINYSVARRTQEIGVRMALGAQPGDAVRLVLWEGVTVTVCGLALGFGLAYWLTRFLKSSLFGVQATDLPTFVSVGVTLAAIALVASYVPASRASRIDPVASLRHE